MSERPLTARNSPLREVVSSPVQAGVGYIDRHLPWVTADHITLTSASVVLGSVAAAAWKPRLGPVMTAPYTVGSLGDALDGARAEQLAKRNGTTTTTRGAIIDTLADRTQEVSTSLSLAEQSRKRGDTFGAVLHTMSAMSSTTPALFRARAEANGVIVPESSFGTRPVRATLGGAAMALGGNKHLSRGLAATSLSLNIFTAYRRSQALKPGSRYALGELTDQKLQKAAAARQKLLGGVALVGASAGVGMLVRIATRARRHNEDEISHSEDM